MFVNISLHLNVWKFFLHLFQNIVQFFGIKTQFCHFWWRGGRSACLSQGNTLYLVIYVARIMRPVFVQPVFVQLSSANPIRLG